jgi:hypothetical protein
MHTCASVVTLAEGRCTHISRSFKVDGIQMHALLLVTAIWMILLALPTGKRLCVGSWGKKISLEPEPMCGWHLETYMYSKADVLVYPFVQGRAITSGTHQAGATYWCKAHIASGHTSLVWVLYTRAHIRGHTQIAVQPRNKTLRWLRTFNIHDLETCVHSYKWAQFRTFKNKPKELGNNSQSNKQCSTIEKPGLVGWNCEVIIQMFEKNGPPLVKWTCERTLRCFNISEIDWH